MSVSQTLAIVLPICVTFLGVVLSIVWYLGNRIDRRFDRIEDRLESIEHGQTDIKVAQAAYAQKLDDHVSDHPGPSIHFAPR